MIEAHHLSRSFGPIRAVHDVSFTVNPGDIVGFLGPNGAGKSTTMKMLAGTLVPDRGNASIEGFDIVSDRPKAQSRLGYMPEAAAGFPDLTVREFLCFCAEARRIKRTDIQQTLEDVADRTSLSPALNKPMGALSKGWRQRAWFAQALPHKPSALILDEPTDGLDPGQKDLIRDYIREISSSTAIILSTHILQEAEELCNRVIIINEGALVTDQPLDDLLDKSGSLAPAFASLTAARSAA